MIRVRGEDRSALIDGSLFAHFRRRSMFAADEAPRRRPPFAGADGAADGEFTSARLFEIGNFTIKQPHRR
jgi:hypothetical protein